MQLVSEKHFPSAKFSLYFMATIPAGTHASTHTAVRRAPHCRRLHCPGVTPPKDPKLDGSEWMKNWDGCVLELTQFVFLAVAACALRANLGCVLAATTALRLTPTSRTGTATALRRRDLVRMLPCWPFNGGLTVAAVAAGHIGFLVDDVYAHSEMLEKAGVPFHKKPDVRGACSVSCCHVLARWVWRHLMLCCGVGFATGGWHEGTCVCSRPRHVCVCLRACKPLACMLFHHVDCVCVPQTGWRSSSVGCRCHRKAPVVASACFNQQCTPAWPLSPSLPTWCAP